MKKKILFCVILTIVTLLAFTLTGCDLFGGKTEEVETTFYNVTVIDGQGSGSYEKGVAVTISPDYVEGKIFSHWMVGEDIVSRDSSYTFSASKDIEIKAIFVDRINAVEVSTNNTLGYVTAGLGNYEIGDTVTVKSKRANNLVFLYWDFDGVNVSSEPDYTFIIERNLIIEPIYDVYSSDLVFEYVKESNSYIVTGYEGVHTYAFDMFIPEHYNDGTNGLKKVTHIANEALMHTNYMRKVTIGKGVIEIGERAFFGCGNLVQVILPDSLATIGEECFTSCFNIKEINIPKNVRNIASTAFTRLTQLEKINVNIENEFYKSVNGILFSKDESVLYCYPANKGIANYTIPTNVTSIGKYTFSGVSLDQVNFESSTEIAEIGAHAFADSAIKKISIPKSVETIGSYAFENSQQLTNVTFAYQSTLKTINGFAFYKCIRIGSLSLPELLETIEESAFEGCTSLVTNLELNIKKIGTSAFKDCGSLLNPFITDSIIYLGENAFLNTTIYGDVYIASEIVINGLSETAYGGLINGKNVHIIKTFVGDLPSYIADNYYTDWEETSQNGMRFYKYIKNN